MRDRMRYGSWSGMIGAGLLVLGVALPLLCYQEMGPFLDPGEIERRNAELHRCNLPGCKVCEHNRQWLQENPGRQIGDIVELANLPGGFLVESSEAASPSPSVEAPLVAEASPAQVAESLDDPREPIRISYVLRWELFPSLSGRVSVAPLTIFPDFVTEPAPIYDGIKGSFDESTAAPPDQNT